jgi:hypothetical protein
MVPVVTPWAPAAAGMSRAQRARSETIPVSLIAMSDKRFIDELQIEVQRNG